MNKEDIILMAREAGFASAKFWPYDFRGLHRCVERFAALVAERERERLTKVDVEPVGKVVDPTYVHFYDGKQRPYGAKLYDASALAALRTQLEQAQADAARMREALELIVNTGLDARQCYDAARAALEHK